MNILRSSYIHVLLEIPAWIDNWLFNDIFAPRKLTSI